MSAFLEWTDNLILGLPEIDEQHLGMLTVLNRLAEVVQLKLGDSEAMDPSPISTGMPANADVPIEIDPCIQQLLEELVQLTRDHFQSEEDFMSECGYPDLYEHKREHTMLSAELKLFVRDITQGSAALDQKTLCSLKQWLIVHIVESDKKFANYLSQAGGRV